ILGDADWQLSVDFREGLLRRFIATSVGSPQDPNPKRFIDLDNPVPRTVNLRSFSLAEDYSAENIPDKDLMDVVFAARLTGPGASLADIRVPPAAKGTARAVNQGDVLDPGSLVKYLEFTDPAQRELNADHSSIQLDLDLNVSHATSAV